MNTAHEFIAQLGEHLSMPAVYKEVRQLIEIKEASIDDFADVIARDSMLKQRMIRIANSPFFGFPRKANSLYQAISLIGIMQLHDLVLNSLCIRTLSNIPQQIFDLRSFWIYSVECGIAAKAIAQQNRIIPNNHFFTFGLLHEVGHAAMYAREPELSLLALEESKQNKCPLTQVEKHYFGFDYTEAGLALAQLWHLPEIYQHVTAHHLTPEKAPSHYQQYMRILQLAHQLCQHLETDRLHNLINQFREMEPKRQQMPQNLIDLIYKDIQIHAEEVFQMLCPHGIQQHPPVAGQAP